MKKSTTLFTLALFAILAFSSCEREQWGNAQKGSDDIDNRAEGQIGLSALKVSVDEKTTSTVTRTGEHGCHVQICPSAQEASGRGRASYV